MDNADRAQERQYRTERTEQTLDLVKHHGLDYLDIPAYLRRNHGHPDACPHGFFTCIDCQREREG